MIRLERPRRRRPPHGRWEPALLSPVVLTALIASLAFATPREVAFSRLLPAAPALAASMWPVLPTALLGTACLLIMIGLSLVFPDLGTAYTAAAIVAVTAAAAYASHVRLQREQALLHIRLVADAAQKVLLRPLPHRIGGIEIESLYLASHAQARIGGDFYEAADTPHGLRLLIGDVRGKGLSAVGTAAAVVNSFREAAYDEPDLTGIARRLETSMVRHSAAHPAPDLPERFATALLAEIPHTGAHLTLLNLGHPPPLLLHRQHVRTLEPTTPFPPLNLAALTRDSYTTDTHPLTPGDQLLLYTDGVTETRSRSGQFFPLADWTRQQPYTPPRQLLDHLHQALLHHTHGQLNDDIAALALHTTDAPGSGSGSGSGSGHPT